MKLSGHSYNNGAMNSLLDGIVKDVVYTKAAQATIQPVQEEAPVGGMDLFSSVTELDFKNIQNEELSSIIGELEFAADRAHVGMSRQHVIDFAKQAMKDGLRGKSLERAAQKFCNKISSDSAPAVGDTRNYLSDDLLNNANEHAVVPAGYNPEFGQNETKTSGYMGQSHNPNSIWDSGKLAEMATQPTGDEKIAQSKAAQAKFAAQQKQQQWEDLQKQMSQDQIIHEKTASVANVATTEHIGNQNLPNNSMNIWGDNGFESLPDKTTGESIKLSEQDIQLQKQANRQEWDKSEPAKKLQSNLLNEITGETIEQQSSHRASVDKIFDGLAGYLNEN